jgi:3-deoxy-7-phosphoheptulonate synthase
MLRGLRGVEQVVPIPKPYKLVSRESHEEPARVMLGSAEFGGDKVCVIAGPCTVESREQLMQAATAVRGCRETEVRSS